MTIDVGTKNGVVILTVTGRMVFDPTLFRLRGHVQEELLSGSRRFIVDLSAVSHLDSSGCGELISIQTSIARAQGALAIVNPQPKVRTLLERIRLNQVLKIAATIEEAEAAIN